MNRRELRDAVRLRNGIPDSGDARASHTDINACVAAGLRDVCAEKRWPWLLTSSPLTVSTVTGEASMPAGWAQIHKVTVNGAKAVHVPLDEFLEGTRRYVWTEFGQGVRFDPVPAVVPSAVTVYYWRDEPELTSDTQEPLLPSVFHQVLVARASYHLNVRRQDGSVRRSEVERDLVEWQAGLKNMMAAAARTVGPRSVRSAFRDTTGPARW
jgi:hypothetical protein